MFSVFSFIKISTIQTDPKELDNKFGIKKNIITATKKAEVDPSMPLYMSYYSVFDKCYYKPWPMVALMTVLQNIWFIPAF